MLKYLKSTSSSLLVGIGPGIQSCHFEIKPDTLEKFADYPEAILKLRGKIFIDLPKIIKIQLVSLGIKGERVENFGECTFLQKRQIFFLPPRQAGSCQNHDRI